MFLIYAIRDARFTPSILGRHLDSKTQNHIIHVADGLGFEPREDVVAPSSDFKSAPFDRSGTRPSNPGTAGVFLLVLVLIMVYRKA
jgi:hypothetical protein